MASLIDFYSQEVKMNSEWLPIFLPPGTETLLTSIFLRVESVQDKLVLQSTIGWKPEPSSLPIVPKLTIRIRRGGFASTFPEVYQITDSEYLGTGTKSANYLTTTINHVDSPDSSMIGTTQHYFLTVQSSGLGSIEVVGPITFTGMTIGF